MRESALLVAVTAVMALSGTVWADDEPAAAQPRMELELVDGSRIIGICGLETVPVQTPYAKMEIPLAQIQTLTMGADHETVSIDLQNGDLLTGVTALGPIELATAFGKVSIGIEHIRKFDVVQAEGIGRRGLVLWNRLGSEGEVQNSRFGPGGRLNGGRFVQGRFGQGIELSMNEQYGVTFPAEVAAGADGCVELWAKLVDFPNALVWGARPALISGDDGQGSQHFIMLNLNGNDGQGHGGLCAVVPGLSATGTGEYGQWTYARALGSDAVGDWHHYAIVWASEGIPGVDNGERRIVAYVDGKLNSAVWHGVTGSTRQTVPANGRFGLLYHQGQQGGRVIYDNLKVWKYAKTDFSDRNDE